MRHRRSSRRRSSMSSSPRSTHVARSSTRRHRSSMSRRRSSRASRSAMRRRRGRGSLFPPMQSSYLDATAIEKGCRAKFNTTAAQVIEGGRYYVLYFNSSSSLATSGATRSTTTAALERIVAPATAAGPGRERSLLWSRTGQGDARVARLPAAVRGSDGGPAQILRHELWLSCRRDARRASRRHASSPRAQLSGGAAAHAAAGRQRPHASVTPPTPPGAEICARARATPRLRSARWARC